VSNWKSIGSAFPLVFVILGVIRTFYRKLGGSFQKVVPCAMRGLNRIRRGIHCVETNWKSIGNGNK
jgi:hypothetical protein